MAPRFKFKSFRQFRRLYGVSVAFGWLLFFLLNNAYLWLFLKNPQTGRCPFEPALEFIFGTVFFLGFLVFAGSAVQARRAYFGDRFAVTEQDLEKLDSYRQSKRQQQFAAPLFVRAFWAGVGFSLFQGGTAALLIYLFLPEGLTSGWFVFGLAWYFAAVASGFATIAIWLSIARMRRWQQDERRIEISALRYTALQNAAAALVVNVPLAFLYGDLKFPALAEQWAEIRGGAPGVPFLALAADLGVTVTIIALLFGGGIRTKVRTELMSEITISDPERLGAVRGRWHSGYAPLLGLICFALCWVVGAALPTDRIGALEAIAVKGTVQGLIGLGVGYWAASRTAAEMIRGGPRYNPFAPPAATPPGGD